MTKQKQESGQNKQVLKLPHFQVLDRPQAEKPTATSDAQSSSPNVKRKGTLRRMMNKLGSPKGIRKAHTVPVTEPVSASLPSVPEDNNSDSTLKADEDTIIDKPRDKGRFTKFVGSVRSKVGRNRPSKVVRHSATAGHLAVSK